MDKLLEIKFLRKRVCFIRFLKNRLIALQGGIINVIRLHNFSFINTASQSGYHSFLKYFAKKC